MVGAVPEVVVLDDVLDLYKLLFGRRYVFQDGVVVAVGLAAAARYFVVEVSVLRDEDGNDLIGDQILPISTCHGVTIAQHGSGVHVVCLCLVYQVPDLRRVSCCHMHMRQSRQAAYRMVSQRVYCLARRAHDLSNGRVEARRTSRGDRPLAAMGAIGVAVAVHLAGRGGWGIRGRQGSSCARCCALYRTLYSKQLAHIVRKGPPCVKGVRVSGGFPCAPRCCGGRWRPDGRREWVWERVFDRRKCSGWRWRRQLNQYL